MLRRKYNVNGRSHPLLCLRVERLRRAIPSHAMARQLGINSGAYSRVELGQKLPSRRVARLLEQKFRMPLEALLAFA